MGDGVALVGAGAGGGQGGCDPAEVVQKGIEHWKIRNGGHILCLEAVPAKLSPQKLVPCSRPSAARQTPTGHIWNSCCTVSGISCKVTVLGFADSDDKNDRNQGTDCSLVVAG